MDDGVAKTAAPAGRCYITGSMNRVLATALLPFLLFLQKPPAPYPQHWWTPAAKDGAPAWEILPQEAGPGEVILSKRNELGLLYFEILTNLRAELARQPR